MKIRAASISILLFMDASAGIAREPTDLSTAGHLLRACETARSGVPSFDAGYCLGRVTGATWTLNVNTTGIADAGSCIPDKVNTDQLVRVFIKFASENPNRLHEPDLRIVFDAMQQAWPCLKVPK